MLKALLFYFEIERGARIDWFIGIDHWLISAVSACLACLVSSAIIWT